MSAQREKVRGAKYSASLLAFLSTRFERALRAWRTRTSALPVSVFLNHIPMDHHVGFRPISSVEQHTAFGLARNHLNPRRNVFLLLGSLRRIIKKALHFGRLWGIEFLAPAQLSHGLDRARGQQLGPKFLEERVGSIDVRAVDLAVDGKDVTDHVRFAVDNAGQRFEVAIRSLLHFFVF